MEQNLQLPVSIWKILPSCYYRNEGEVENIVQWLVHIYIILYSYYMGVLSKHHSRNSPSLGLRYKCWHQRDPAKWGPEATHIHRP